MREYLALVMERALPCFMGGRNQKGKNVTSQVYIGMLSHSLGGAVICISLQHFIAPALGLMPCLPSRQGGRQ